MLTTTKTMINKVAMESVLALGLLTGAQVLSAQPPPRPVDATIHHLQEVVAHNGAYSGRERSRYDNALRHLSEFQARLQRGNFDKDKLDEAIGNVQDVVDKNPLDARSRDLLWHDLSRLRAMRSSYDHGGPVR